jgi:hypothetical protein
VFAVGRRLRAAVLSVADVVATDLDAAALDARRATEAAEEAERLAVADAVADARTAAALAAAVLAAVRRALADPDPEPATKVVRQLLRLRRALALHVDLDRPQELLVAALAARSGDPALRKLAELVGVAAT